MKLGIVIPVWLTEVEVLWQSTYRAVRSIDAQTNHSVYIVPNRLHRMLYIDLADHLLAETGKTVQVLPWDGARSVAASWNQGVRMARRDGCDRLLIMANDCYWESGAVDEMVRYGDSPESLGASMWSGFDPKGNQPPPAPFEGCDFTGFMIRPETLETTGWFDERFRPAYFEDNDYATRVALSGGTCRVLPTARFEHAGSLTARSDAEAAHHVKHWFESNRARYFAKWGVQAVPTSEAECRERCYRTPWNDPSLTVRDWDR